MIIFVEIIKEAFEVNCCFLFSKSFISFSFSQDEHDWTGKYIFEKKKDGVIYTYIIKVDKLNNEYVGNIIIKGGLQHQDILAFSKIEKDKLHLFFSSYKESNEELFKYGDIVVTLERRPNLEIYIYVYGFEPLPEKDGKLVDKKKGKKRRESIKFNGHLETYYAWDTDEDKSLRQFSATSPYRDRFGLNIVQLSASYTVKRFHANFGIHFGEMVDVNWPSGTALKYVQEANLGFEAAKNLWFDFGLFITHIGAESLFPRYNYFNTLSLATYFEPVYQSGVRMSYSSEKFYMQLHVLNGYNQLTDNNKNKSFGLQLGWKPNDKIDLTYNNIIGNEQPLETNNPKLRLYNNFVVKIFPGKKVDLLFCVDHAMQEKSKISDSTSGAVMISGLAALRFTPWEKLSFGLRYEYFKDDDGFLSGTFVNSDGELTGLNTMGLSFCIELRPVKFAYIRLDTRYLIAKSGQNIFYNNRNSRFELILSTGASF